MNDELHGPEDKWCAVCKEDFPVSTTGLLMGHLTPLAEVPAKVRRHSRVVFQAGYYLCGNCYFDTLDELGAAS